MNKIKIQYEKNLELIFKISFLCLALATFNGYLYISKLQPVFVKVTLGLGVLLILVRIIRYKKYVKMPGIFLMLLFCISFAFSSFMNRQYEFWGNMKWVIWTGILFFALYVCDLERDREVYRKEFRIVSHILILYTMLSAIIGILMMLTSFSNILSTIDGELVTVGFTWGRLWGVYTDPNYGSVISAISIVLALLFFMQRKGVLRILYGFSIFANYLYIVFSDSRTGRIALACSLACYLYVWCIRKNEKKVVWKRQGISVITAVCAVVLVLGGSYGIKKEYNQVIAPVLKTLIQTQNNLVQPKKPQNSPKSQKPIETVGRKADIEKDVSNGRLALWESAVEIWKTSPVYGTGYTSLISYCEENVPDSYVINNSQTDYTSMHNAFLNTLVFQGIIGLVLLLLIVGRIMVYCIPYLVKLKGNDYLEFAAMLSSVGAVVLSMIFLLEGTYTNSPGSFVLWGFSGYMVHTVYKNRLEEEK